MANKPKKSLIKGLVETIIAIVVILFIIYFLSGYFGGKKSTQDSTAKFIEQRDKLDACNLEAQTAVNTLDYKTASAKFSECRSAINTILLELQKLNRENPSREYDAMIIDYTSVGLYYDGEKIAMEAISDTTSENTLTQDQARPKLYAASSLLNQSINMINELELKYSDTDYYKAGYGTSRGQETLKAYKQLVASEMQATEDMIKTI